MIRSGLKRSVHNEGFELAYASMSEAEKRIWNDKADAINGAEEAVKKESSFPGADVQVIPITSKEREFYIFGFLPDWATSGKDKRMNFNARSDSLRVKPTWKKAWHNNQRCLVCASGFYETDRATKMRHFFSVKGKEEIFFAGIFNHWKKSESNNIFKTFAIITHEPNELVLPVHNRMPVILNDAAQKIWLDTTPEETVFNLLQSYPADLMESKEVPLPPRKKKGGTELDLEF